MSAGELASVLRAVRMHADGTFSFPPDAPPAPADALVHALYAGAFARGLGELPPAADSIGEAELVRLLSAANRSRDRWLPGWRIIAVEKSGAIVARQGRSERVAKPGEYALTFTWELRPRAGMAATLLFPRESLTLQEHVYYAFGETLPDGGDESRPSRIYVHAPIDALPELYERLTGELNRLAIPFTLKTMLAPGERDRRDATVLYVPREHCARAEAVFALLPEPLRSRLGPGVPLFTRKLAPGIGAAESPGGGESFGMQRCRLLAEGIRDAWHAGQDDDEGRLLAVRRRFAAAGIDWQRPDRAASPRIVLSATNAAEWLGLDAGEWTVTDRSSRNRNFAVARADGTGFFVKQLRVQGAASLEMMEREAAVYEWSATNAEMRHLAPPFVRFDAAAQALVLELLPGAQSVALLPDRHMSTEVARAAARTLAVLHRQTPPRSPLLERRPPGIYTGHRGGPLLRWLSAAQMQLIDRVRASPTLAPALDAMASEWRADHPIHGDVKWENCLWTAESKRLHWIDWELFGAGDPHWDAGCFVQAYLAHGIVTRSPLDIRPIDAFLGEYDAAARKPIFRCAAARLIQAALEVMHGQPAPTPLALELFTAGERLMARPQ